ncbi:MAG: hypothetical protein P8Z50_00010 [candidate division WOR-3 bacterium]
MTAQAMQKVSEIEGITLLHFRLKGVDHRKKLVSRDIIYWDFPLVRVLIKYKCGNKGEEIVQSRLIYPNNVYPYGRKTLEVLEDIADKRYVDRTSWKDLGDIFYESYDFSVENLKRSIIRVNVAFNRLLTVGLIQALNIVQWRFGEREQNQQSGREPPGFITFSFLYREKLFFVIFGAKLAISSSSSSLSLSSDFDLFRK